MERMEDARYRAELLKGKLREAMDRAKQESVQVDDPQARALFEVTAEVLGGLTHAFEHYEAGTEPAFRRPDMTGVPRR